MKLHASKSFTHDFFNESFYKHANQVDCTIFITSLRQGGSRTMSLACFRDHILLQSLSPYLLRWYVWIYPSPMKIHYRPFFKNLSQKVNNPKWPLDDLWPHICWCFMCDSTQGSLCPSPMVIHQSMWIQWLFFKNLNQKVSDPKMTFDPTPVEVTCVTLPKNHCIQVPWKCVKVCGYSDLFFSKNWTKGHWPLEDLWPQIYWGLMCDSTPQNSKYKLEGKILHQQCNRLFPARCQTYAN